MNYHRIEIPIGRAPAPPACPTLAEALMLLGPFKRCLQTFLLLPEHIIPPALARKITLVQMLRPLGQSAAGNLPSGRSLRANYGAPESSEGAVSPMAKKM